MLTQELCTKKNAEDPEYKWVVKKLDTARYLFRILNLLPTNVFRHYHWKSIITEKTNTPQRSVNVLYLVASSCFHRDSSTRLPLSCVTLRDWIHSNTQAGLNFQIPFWDPLICLVCDPRSTGCSDAEGQSPVLGGVSDPQQSSPQQARPCRAVPCRYVWCAALCRRTNSTSSLKQGSLRAAPARHRWSWILHGLAFT